MQLQEGNRLPSLWYKSFCGSAEVILGGRYMAGSIQYIEDEITYLGKDFSELKYAFEAAVESYIRVKDHLTC